MQNKIKYYFYLFNYSLSRIKYYIEYQNMNVLNLNAQISIQQFSFYQSNGINIKF